MPPLSPRPAPVGHITRLLGTVVATAALLLPPLPAQAQAATDCKVDYSLTNEWDGGFSATATITNTGDTPVEEWTITWSFSGDQRVTNAWNGEVVQQGGDVTATNASWNGHLDAGAGATVGFQGTHSGATPSPENLTCVLGPADGDPGGPEDGDGEDGDGTDEATRIMPLGDSITGSPGCWRALLWQDLRESGHDDLDFVGTQPHQDCGIEHDGDHEGHGGALVTDVADQGRLVDRLATTEPDIALMHFGTNDVWNGIPTDTILDGYSELVAQMRAENPDMVILVAQIIPMDPDRSCASCGQGVIDLNSAIPAWAEAESTPRSPITVVDQWSGFDTSADTYDGVHPSDSGDQKIAQRWSGALTPILD